MCGIVGLFAKTKEFENELGKYFSGMLNEMTDRGPDSAGCAIYHNVTKANELKIVAMSEAPLSKNKLLETIRQPYPDASVQELESLHFLITLEGESKEVILELNQCFPNLKILSSGSSIEIYKAEGLPKNVLEKFSISSMTGSHALGHTRMATESAITTAHSHPFSTGDDLCLVHNGSLSNHNRLRAKLQKEGIDFSSDNDSEVAAGYLAWRIKQGKTIEEALNHALEDLDGFYTFAIGTKDGFAVLRDPIACKPAVISETDHWVAMASEYRAIALLPGAQSAPAWEPAPGKIYSWSH